MLLMVMLMVLLMMLTWALLLILSVSWTDPINWFFYLVRRFFAKYTVELTA